MGEFKPMVKMDTTEPTVELKLKKGGSVAHKPMKGKAESQKTVKKAMGGGLGALANSPAMIASAPMAKTVAGPKRPALALRRRAMAGKAMPTVETPVMVKKGGKAEKMCGGGKMKKMATGGVVNGNGGGYKTGGVDNGQGGFKYGGSTGDVKLGNAGGYKKGGATKKFANGGSAVQMPQGNKPVPKPVYINELAGTYKKGGKVKKFKDGDYVDAMQKNNTKGYNATYANETAENEADAKAVRDAITYIPRKIGALYDKAKNALVGPSVTNTKTTVSRTVVPPKRDVRYAPSPENAKFNDDYKKGGKAKRK